MSRSALRAPLGLGAGGVQGGRDGALPGGRGSIWGAIIGYALITAHV